MSDYTPITTFTTKDGLSTGDPEKIISGADVDAEFSAIQTAIATKYDSADVASEAQAQAETSNSVLMTPLRVANWADANVGVVGDLQAISGLAAGGDKLFFFDDTDDTVKALTVGTGIAITTTTIATDDSAIAHDSLSGFVANEHIDHSSVSITAGSGLTGGGTIASTRTINVGAGNGITVNADDVALASSTAGAGLTYSSGVLAVGAGSGITVNADDVALANQSATASVPVSISSGTLGFSLSGITEITMPNFSQSADKILVSDAGTLKVMPYDDAGIKVASVGGTTDILAAGDMNTFIEYTSATAVTVTLNTGVGTVGNVVIIKQTGAGKVTIAGTATVESADSLVSTRTTDSVICLVCIAANTWALYGDLGA